MTTFDYIFVGAGVAGLSTALAIARRHPQASMALVDPNRAREDHRTFGYWFEGASLLPDGVGREWRGWTVSTPERAVRVELDGWRYETFDIQQWKDAVTRQLESLADVTWLADTVSHLESTGSAVRVEAASGESWQASWVFDSRPLAPPDAAPLVLWQCFRGATVRATSDAPQELHLMAFRPRDERLLFAYVVPGADDTVFVESVVTSPNRSPSDDAFELESMVADRAGEEHEVLAREGGRTPLTTARFARRAGPRVANIGLRGGAARASTGYAFVTMHREAEAIADALVQTGEPWGRAPKRWRERFLDGVLLTVIAEFPRRAPDAFMALFERARTDRVLRLLDDRATWTDIAAIAWVLPWLLFLRAWWTWLWTYRDRD